MVLAKSKSKVAKKPARSTRNADDEVEEDTDDGEASAVLSDGSGHEEPDRFAATMQKRQQAQGSQAAAWLNDEKPMKGPRAMKGKKRMEGGTSDEENAEPPVMELSKTELAAVKKAEAKALQLQLKEHAKAKVALKKAAATLKTAAAKEKKDEATAKSVCKKKDAILAKLAKLRAAAQKVRDAATAAADSAKGQLADAEWACALAAQRLDGTAPPKQAMKEKVAKAMKGGAMKKAAKGAKKPGMKASMKAMKVAMKAMKAKRR